MTLKNQIMISRLKKQMMVHGINARELSEKANVGKSFVYDILSGKSANPTTQKIQAVADVLGVSLPYLTCKNNNDNEINSDDYVFVETLFDENLKSSNKTKLKISFKKEWIKKNLNTDTKNVRAIKIAGDYMSPTLQNGDIALVDISKKSPNPPGIYVVHDGVGLAAKRLECVNKADETIIFITPDNKNYKSYESKLAETNIIGKIIWFSRAMN
jgi:transcriptional regulator with XRE-family HTH domain